jgi:merlin protein
MVVSAASHTLLTESDLQDLSLEIERERHEYLEKSKHLQEQLKTLKNEIEELKVDDKVSVLDQLHKEQQEQGDTKYSTIQKVKRGSMQSRVAYFEEL